MDILSNKRYEQYNYLCRYLNVPYYTNTIDKREIYGIGENMLFSGEYVIHELAQEDTLESLALTYYGDPTLWWIIAYYNHIQDSFIVLIEHYQTILIPNRYTIEFGALR